MKFTNPTSFNLLKECITKFGKNSNSFMTLYPGFQYYFPFRPENDDLVSFVETPHAWVAAAEPLCPPERREALLRRFARTAKTQGKVAVFIPVESDVLEDASRAGYGRIMIGTEPVFDLNTYHPHPGVVETAKRLQNHGAEVRSFKLEDTPLETKEELDGILQDWLSTRRMGALEFLNKVEPFSFYSNKRFFWIEYKKRILAFVSCIPNWNRNGWYLIDLIRVKETPPGTTELLILEAMKTLKSEGAKEISLGVSPLAHLNEAPNDEHPWIYKGLRLVFEKFDMFYQFKTLYQFKRKFKPTSYRNAYVIFSPNQLSFRLSMGIGKAFIGGSLLKTAGSALFRLGLRFRPDQWMHEHLAEDVVVLNAPESGIESFGRVKLTTFLLFANLLVYFITHINGGQLSPETAAWFSFSRSSIYDYHWYSWITAAFLHWNLTHIFLNTVTLILFAGLLEYLAGTLFMASVYAVSAFLSNALTWFLIFAPLKHLDTPFWGPVHFGQDVGASLGIFGCAGALSLLFKKGSYLIIFLAAITLVQFFVSGDFLTFNHWFALSLGAIMAKQLLARQRIYTLPQTPEVHS